MVPKLDSNHSWSVFSRMQVCAGERNNVKMARNPQVSKIFPKMGGDQRVSRGGHGHCKPPRSSAPAYLQPKQVNNNKHIYNSQFTANMLSQPRISNTHTHTHTKLIGQSIEKCIGVKVLFLRKICKKKNQICS